MKSLGAMIIQLQALVGTSDLSAWELRFVVHLYDLTHRGRDTLNLSEQQVGMLVQIYAKHFGDAEAA